MGAAGIGQAINQAIDIVADLAPLFSTSEEGRQRQRATADQERMIQQALGIQDRVANGTLNPGTALRMLRNLMRIAQVNMGDENRQAGMAAAMEQINNIMGNVQDAYYHTLRTSIPYQQGGTEYRDGVGLVRSGEVGRGGAGGLGDYFLDPQQQVDWIKQQLRNRMMGFTAGQTNLEGSPMEGLFKPAFDPYAASKRALGQAQNAYPSYQEPTGFEAIRRRLQGVNNG